MKYKNLFAGLLRYYLPTISLNWWNFLVTKGNTPVPMKWSKGKSKYHSSVISTVSYIHISHYSHISHYRRLLPGPVTESKVNVLASSSITEGTILESIPYK